MDTNTSPKDLIKEHLKTLDVELRRAYEDLHKIAESDDEIENDYALISRLSITVAMCSLLTVMIENIIDDNNLNYMIYKSRLGSMKELVSSLKASLYARSAKVKSKLADYEREKDSNKWAM